MARKRRKASPAKKAGDAFAADRYAAGWVLLLRAAGVPQEVFCCGLDMLLRAARGRARRVAYTPGRLYPGDMCAAGERKGYRRSR